MPRPLPVTLVGGFLGAGKTSLLHHLVQEHRGGHLALFVEEAGPLALDTGALRGLGGAMRRMHDRIATIPARDDLAWLEEQLRDGAASGRFERVLIEVGGLSGLERWRRELAPRLGEAIEWRHAVCVVDALDFSRGIVAAKTSGRADPLAGFCAAQIAEATLLVLNKCDLVSQAERDACLRALLAMNPTAEVTETAYGEIDPALLDRPVTQPKPAPTAGEAGPPALGASLFRAHRPFHPQRFWDWFQAGHDGLLRAKGLVWLASRNLLVGGVSRTRWQNACGPAGVWWAALPREDWPQEEDKLAAMQETWREPYGDRRQELLLLGYQSALPSAIGGLNRCLLTPEEYALAPAAWASFRDPFPDWDLGGDQG